MGVRTTARLLRCGVAAGPLFITTALVAGATRADYNPLRHPVSSLALGPGGWVQVTNFLVASVLGGAAAVGLARAPLTVPTRVGPVLVGAAAAGLLGSGAFLTDPVSGYPVGTPDLLTEHSSTGALLHDLFALPTFLGLPAAALVYAWAFRRAGERGWAGYSAASGVAGLAGIVVTSAAFAQVPALVASGGLLQRLTVAVDLGWLTAVSLRALAATRSEPRSGAAAAR